jgi:hypothetical protein
MHEQAHIGHAVPPSLSPFTLSGVATAVTAFLVNLGVENISGFKFWATFSLLERGGLGWGLASFAAFTAMNAALVFAAVGITLFVGPAAAGRSGCVSGWFGSLIAQVDDRWAIVCLVVEDTMDDKQTAAVGNCLWQHVL